MKSRNVPDLTVPKIYGMGYVF